jgi:general secretion pathway protein K
MRNERGFALLSVMLVLALLAVVVTEFSVSARLESSMIRSYRDGVLATHLAEGAVQQALREILGPGTVVALDDDGSLSFYRTPDTGTGSTVNVSTKVARLPRERVPLGAGEFSYRISDEEARVNVNTASPDRIERLLTATGLDKQTRDIINDSLQDWKDADDLHRINGAESEDYYLKQPVPYRARNGALQDAAELLQIRGVTREIYRGVQDHPGLADLVTVVGRDTVNMNTAPAPVLTSLGLSDAEVAEITSTRARIPYTAVPPRFAGKGLGVGSATFRIEAEGRIGGEPRARIVAIVQRQAQLSSAGATGVKATVLSWRPSEP